MSQTQVTRSAFREAVSQGMTKKELSTHFNIPAGIITTWAKELELKITIKRTTTPKYVLVDESFEPTSEGTVILDNLEETN
jgi:transposase